MRTMTITLTKDIIKECAVNKIVIVASDLIFHIKGVETDYAKLYG